MDPKRVLHIVSRFTTGGAERLVLAFAERADPKRYAITVAAVREGIFGNILGFVKRERPDIVHTHLFSGDCMGYILKRLYRETKWISTQHNVEAYAPRWKQLIWKRILRRADAVVAVSAAVEAWCRNGFSIPEKNLHVIPNAIVLDAFLAIPPQAPVAPVVWELASIGRLERQKGHDILLAALKELRDVPWRLSLYGDGSQKKHVAQYARSEKMDDRVRLCGIRDAADALRASHIVVQPSRWEGRSLAVMEAMAAGRCVALSEAAGAELVEHGKTGIVVPTDDAHALAVALRRLMNDPAEVARLGANARAYAQAHFGFDQWLNAMDELYRTI